MRVRDFCGANCPSNLFLGSQAPDLIFNIASCRDKERHHMPSRRRFLTSAAATGVALSMQGTSAAVAQQKRVIVDSQVHLWPANTQERPWLSGGKPQLPEPFTIERIVPLMDSAEVDRVVIVPPVSLEGERIDYAQEAV